MGADYNDQLPFHIIYVLSYLYSYKSSWVAGILPDMLRLQDGHTLAGGIL